MYIVTNFSINFRVMIFIKISFTRDYKKSFFRWMSSYRIINICHLHKNSNLIIIRFDNS